MNAHIYDEDHIDLCNLLYQTHFHFTEFQVLHPEIKLLTHNHAAIASTTC